MLIKITFFLFFFLSSCLPQPSASEEEAVGFQEGQKANVVDVNSSLLDGASDPQTLDPNAEGSKAETLEDLRKEPYDALAFVNPGVTAIDSGIFSGVQVPSIEIYYETAEYAQVLRCVESYEFKTHFGDSIETLDSSIDSLKQKETMWFNALRNESACKLVSYETRTLSLQDYTAPTGRFYYVLNPCLTAESSVTRQDDCSYRLGFTNVIEYTEQIREQVHQKAIEVSVKEQEIQALLQEAKILSKLLETKLRACENTIAIENADKKKLGGLLDAVIYVGSILIIIGTTGNIGNATMLAEIAVGMGSQMFLKQALRLGEVPNTCLDAGKYTGVDMFTGLQTEASQSLARRFEAMYGVVETYNRLEQILVDSDISYTSATDEGDGGFLEIKLAEYNLLLYEMAQEDNRVLQLDQLYQEQ